MIGRDALPPPDLRQRSPSIAPPQELHEVVDKVGFGFYQKRLMVIVGIIFASEAVSIFMLSFVRHKVQADLPGATPLLLNWATTFLFLGMLVGGVMFGTISDQVGRRMTVLASLIVPLIACLGIAAAPDIYAFIAAQFLLGFGVGGGHVAPALLTELLPAANRELYIVISYSWWTIGVLLLCLEAFLLRDMPWRYLAGVAIWPFALCLACFPFIPESPRWLRIHGKEDAALKVMQNVAAANGVLLQDVSLVVPQPDTKMMATEKLRVLFSPSLRRQTVTLWTIWGSVNAAYYGMAMLSTQQLVGKESSGQAYVMAALEAFGEAPAYVLLYLCSHRFGRRRPLILSPVVAAVFLLLMRSFDDGGERSFSNPSFVLAAFCALVSRCATLFAFDLVFLYTPEVYPTAIRTTATGSCCSVSRVSSLFTPFVAYTMAEYSPLAPYALFTTFLMVASAAATFLVTETLQKELDDAVPATPLIRGSFSSVKGPIRV